jgi:lysozyme
MRISQTGVDLIKHFETCELEAYPDPASPLGRECSKLRLPMRKYRQIPNWQQLRGDPWTIGWGHTGPEVVPGLRWDQHKADRTKESDLLHFERGVLGLIAPTVTYTQGEFDALVSFAYNCGLDIDEDTIPEGLGDSTLLKKFNAGDKLGAADEFPKWNKAQGRVLAGLVRRRAAERALFLGQDWRKAAGAA